MKTLLSLLHLTTEYFQKRGFEHPRKEAQEVLSLVLGIPPIELYLNFDRPIDESELNSCRSIMSRRANREPFQYIRGEVEFYGCQISVDQDVLIPRQETELLADLVVKEISRIEYQGKVLWDLCTGSGCLGISVKKALPSLSVVLSDLSQKALKKAALNAKKNGVEVEIRHGDLFVPFLGEKADFILCNPPYIAESEYSGLEPEVRDFEPKEALISGATGLEFYTKLAKEASLHLKPKGALWLEIGASQGEEIGALFKGNGVLIKDLSGQNRFFYYNPLNLCFQDNT